MAQLMPLTLTVSCFSKIQIGFTFLVPAHPGSPGKGAVKRLCVCVCVCAAPAVLKQNAMQRNYQCLNEMAAIYGKYLLRQTTFG